MARNARNYECFGPLSSISGFSVRGARCVTFSYWAVGCREPAFLLLEPKGVQLAVPHDEADLDGRAGQLAHVVLLTPGDGHPHGIAVQVRGLVGRKMLDRFAVLIEQLDTDGPAGTGVEIQLESLALEEKRRRDQFAAFVRRIGGDEPIQPHHRAGDGRQTLSGGCCRIDRPVVIRV